MDLLKCICALPLFQFVAKRKLEEINITSRCFVHHEKRNKVIHLQNNICTSVDVIVSGVISVQALEASGNIITIANFSNGESIGSNLLFSSNPAYPMTVIAKTEVLFVSFGKDIILDLCRICPDFLLHFLNEISDKAVVLTNKINTIALKNIRERIIEFLRLEIIRQDSDTIILPFSKKEWAELLGVQRPSLSRELNKMRKAGLIEFDNRRVTLLVGRSTETPL